MGKKGLIINVSVIGVISIILFILSLSFSNSKVGSYMLLEDRNTEDQVDIEDYNTEIISGILEKDAYEIRFGEIIFYKDLDEVYVPLIASEIEERAYEVNVRKLGSNKPVEIIRTGVKSHLYYSFENVYWFVDSTGPGTYVIEVTYENEVIEKLNIIIN